LPLIQLHLSDGFTLDGHASVAYGFETDELTDTYMIGATKIW